MKKPVRDCERQEHILEAAKKNEKPHITREDLEITSFVLTLGQSIKPLPEDFDYNKAMQEYLMRKYG